MHAILMGSDWGRELCEAWGLGDLKVRSMVLDMPLDDVATVAVELALSEEEMEAGVEVLRRFQLVEIDDDGETA